MAPLEMGSTRGVVSDADVVTGGDVVEPQRIGAAQETVELEVTVALDARVRCLAGLVRSDIGVDHVAGEVVTEVEDVMGDAQVIGDPTGVVDVGHRTTTAVALAAPQLHRDADDLVPLFEQERSGDR